jgi:uncharacterized membrane protein YgcG
VTKPRNELTAAELLVLRDPNRTGGQQALKLTLMELLARQGLTLRREERRGLLGSVQTTEYLDRAPDAGRSAVGTPHIVAALEVVSAAAGPEEGASVEAVVRQAQLRFGGGMAKYVAEYVRPELVARGLLEERAERMLLIFPVRRHRHTAAGEQVLRQLSERIERGRELPGLLGSSPVEAAALALSLGSAILLVDELKPHYTRLSQAMRDSSSDAGSNPALFASDTSGRDEQGDETTGSFDGSFDIAAFDSLGAFGDIGSFESSFDSAAGGESGSGSGSDGGDGGDGGGDGGGGD